MAPGKRTTKERPVNNNSPDRMAIQKKQKEASGSARNTKNDDEMATIVENPTEATGVATAAGTSAAGTSGTREGPEPIIWVADGNFFQGPICGEKQAWRNLSNKHKTTGFKKGEIFGDEPTVFHNMALGAKYLASILPDCRTMRIQLY